MKRPRKGIHRRDTREGARKTTGARNDTDPGEFAKVHLGTLPARPNPSSPGNQGEAMARIWSHAGAACSYRSHGRIRLAMQTENRTRRRQGIEGKGKLPGVSCKQGTEQDWTDLPASVVGQPGNLHSIGRSTRARRGAFVATTHAFSVAVSAGELDGEALSHEDSAILSSISTDIDDSAYLEWYGLWIWPKKTATRAGGVGGTYGKLHR